MFPSRDGSKALKNRLRYVEICTYSPTHGKGGVGVLIGKIARRVPPLTLIDCSRIEVVYD